MGIFGKSKAEKAAEALGVGIGVGLALAGLAALGAAVEAAEAEASEKSRREAAASNAGFIRAARALREEARLARVRATDCRRVGATIEAARYDYLAERSERAAGALERATRA